MKMQKSIRDAYRRSMIFDIEKDTCFGRCLKWSIKIMIKIQYRKYAGICEDDKWEGDFESECVGRSASGLATESNTRSGF